MSFYKIIKYSRKKKMRDTHITNYIQQQNHTQLL